ncbi:MAG: translation initiation factor IF-2 [Enterobacterales bacterium]
MENKILKKKKKSLNLKLNKKNNNNLNKKINKIKKNKINIIKFNKNKKIFENKFKIKTNISKINKFKKKVKKNLLIQKFIKPFRSINKNINLEKIIKLSVLANKISIKKINLNNKIKELGLKLNINNIIDQETAYLLTEEMGHNVFLKNFNQKENLNYSFLNKDKNLNLTSRMPIVTIMGHVDHGKTSILQYILKNKIIIKEAIGITQHIGYYSLKTKNCYITFLDTPGHSAFNYIRYKVAKLTDIILLVIAADDGLMPQTIESIKNANNYKVPIIVVINKIDKLGSNIHKIKNDLTKYNIVSKEWGGKNQFINVSAKSGKGIDKLIDSILLQSKLLNLKTRKYGNAKGVVIESYIDKGLGPVSIIIVKKGILNKNDIVLCGLEYGKIRSIFNENNKYIKNSKLSLPIKIIGLSGITKSGDKFKVVKDEKKARNLSILRKNKLKNLKLSQTNKYNLENIFKKISNIKNNEINIIIKADVHGSCEAIIYSLNELSKKKIKINIIKSDVGNINENDTILAYTSNSIILGFNVVPNIYAKNLVEFKKIDVRYYISIYDLIKELKKIIKEMISHNIKQKIIGIAEVKNIFNSKKIGIIAGCIVTNGIIKKNKKIIVLHKNKIVYKGILESLKRFKNDVFEIKKGIECGINMNKYKDISLGDIIKVIE